MGLSHIRDRVIENYTWSYVAYHEEELSLARMIFAKIVVLIALLDDTYDVYAYTSIEECRMLNAAFQGLDIFMRPNIDYCNYIWISNSCM